MSPLGGVNPANQLYQEMLQEAQRHGGHGHGGHGRVRQTQNGEAAELEETKQVKPRAFVQTLKEAEEDRPAIEAKDELDDDAEGRQRDNQGQQPDEEEPDPEDEAARVLAEWQAMNPGRL